MILALMLLQDAAVEEIAWYQYSYLARHQAEDGSWGGRPKGCTCAEIKPMPPAKLDERELAALVAALSDDDPSARERATWRLVEAGPTAEAALKKAAASTDGEVRSRAEALLRSIRLGRVVLRPSAEAQTAAALLSFVGAGFNQMTREVREGRCFWTAIKKGLMWTIERLKAQDLAPRDRALLSLALVEAYETTGTVILKVDADEAVAKIAALPQETGAWDNDAMATCWSLMVLKTGESAGLPAHRDVMTRGIEWLRARALEGDELEAAAYLAVSRFDGKEREDAAILCAVTSWSLEGTDPLMVWLVSLGVEQHTAPRGTLQREWLERRKKELSRRRVIAGCEKGSSGASVWATALLETPMFLGYR